MASALLYTIGSAVVVFLFLAGLWFIGAIINGPNFHPKLTLGGNYNYKLQLLGGNTTIGYSVSCCISC